jgi:hypothetical protein
MAKKLIVDTNLTEGIRMFGMVTHLKDYRFAFFINNVLGIHLKRYGDFQLKKDKGSYSWYYFNKGKNYPKITLISNNHHEGKLIPEHKMDYFIIFKNIYDEKIVSDFILKIRKIPDLSMAFPVDMSKIKNIDILLMADELHELDQVIRPEKSQ